MALNSRRMARATKAAVKVALESNRIAQEAAKLKADADRPILEVCLVINKTTGEPDTMEIKNVGKSTAHVVGLVRRWGYKNVPLPLDCMDKATRSTFETGSASVPPGGGETIKSILKGWNSPENKSAEAFFYGYLRFRTDLEQDKREWVKGFSFHRAVDGAGAFMRYHENEKSDDKWNYTKRIAP